MTTKPKRTKRRKYIDLSHHYLWQKLRTGNIGVLHVPVAEQSAENLTKPLNRVSIWRQCRILKLGQIQTQFWDDSLHPGGLWRWVTRRTREPHCTERLKPALGRRNYIYTGLHDTTRTIQILNGQVDSFWITGYGPRLRRPGFDSHHDLLEFTHYDGMSRLIRDNGLVSLHIIWSVTLNNH